MTDQEATDLREQRKLPCKLTQPEFNVKATEFAQADNELDELEAKKKKAMDDFKDLIGGVNARRSELRKIILLRSEQRDVSCTWHADWASKSMLLRRDDTGEVVEARTMTSEEVQGGFDFTDEGKHLPPGSDDDKPLGGPNQ